MATDVRYFTVGSEAELRSAIESHTIQGFVVASREGGQVTLRKDKEFNVVWAVVGFFLCLLPLLIYLIVYATQKDIVVVVRVGTQLQISDDGRFWWDGIRWANLSPSSLPPGMQPSPDGKFWWDGTRWRPFVDFAPSPPPFITPPGVPPSASSEDRPS